jgi:hypothetical protein
MENAFDPISWISRGSSNRQPSRSIAMRRKSVTEACWGRVERRWKEVPANSGEREKPFASKNIVLSGQIDIGDDSRHLAHSTSWGSLVRAQYRPPPESPLRRGFSSLPVRRPLEGH